MSNQTKITAIEAELKQVKLRLADTTLSKDTVRALLEKSNKLMSDLQAAKIAAAKPFERSLNETTEL